MAGNILKGIINVEIPGVEATTKKAGAAVEVLGSTVQKTASSIESSAQKMAVSFAPIAPAVGKAAQSFSVLQKQVAAFGGGAQSFASSFVNPLKNIPTAVDPAVNSLKKIPGASNAATLSMTNLGRVVQDAPFGFLGIANNLNPLLESFQRLKQTTGSTGGALKALGSSLTGAGGLGFGISVVSSLLIVFGDRLFGAKAASEASENALKSYGEALDDVKGKVNDLSDALQFYNSLGAINVKIRGAGDLSDLIEQSVAQRQLTFDLNKQLEDAKKERERINKDEELNEKDRVEALKKAGDTIREVQTKITDSERTQSLLYRKIKLQRIEDDKEANKKAEEEFERFFNKTISQAKELESFFAKTIVPLHFDLDPQAPKPEQLRKALSFIERAMKTGAIFPRVNIPVVTGVNLLIDRAVLTDEVTKKAAETYEEVRRKFAEVVKNLPRPQLVIQTDVAVNAGLAKEKKDIEDFKQFVQGAASQIAESFGTALGDAFSGKDIGGGLLALLGDVIIQLGKAVIQFGVIKKIVDSILSNPLGVSGAKALAIGIAAIAVGTAIKNIRPQGRAAGGFVDAGKPYMVGEVGRELFVPNVGGRIIPNNQIGQGSASFSVPRIQVVGEFIQRGKDMVATIQQVQGFQGRNA